jgi:hypothetical protein
VLLVGHKGSGKTVLLQQLLRGIPSAVVVDSKHDAHEWEPFCARNGYARTGDVDAISRWPRVVWLCPAAALLDRAGWRRPGSAGWVWTEALQRIGRRRNTVVVLEEAMHTASSTAVHPELRRLVTQGRSQGVSVWAASQAVNHVDTVLLAEADHAIAFVQPLPEYRLLLRSRRGVDSEVLAGLPPHAFGHHLRGGTSWTLFRALSARSVRNGTGMATTLQRGNTGPRRGV